MLCRNSILEALIQLLTVPEIKLMDRNVDKPAFTHLLTKCLIKATRDLKERYQVNPFPAFPFLICFTGLLQGRDFT